MYSLGMRKREFTVFQKRFSKESKHLNINEFPMLKEFVFFQHWELID